MAVSPQNQDVQHNSKPEEDGITTASNINNNEGRKDLFDASPSSNIESSTITESTGASSTTPATSNEHQSDHMSSPPITNEVDLATSPQNTIGLPCGENRNEATIVTNNENTRSTSVHVPPALPPRPANLQTPIVVNGLPHPPHAFNVSQGRFVYYWFIINY